MTDVLVGRKFGKDARLDLLTEESLTEMYQALSLDQIGRVTGISRSTVQRLFEEYGIPRRSVGAHAPNAHLKPLYYEQYSPRNRPLAARRRIELSAWRLYVLAGRCPWTCRYLDECDRFDGGDPEGCRLKDYLAAKGELARRPWEPEDYRERILARLGQDFTKSLESEE